MTRLEAATDGPSLRDASRQVLGKRSELARLHTLLRDLPAEQRKEVGAWINSARTRLQERSDALAGAFEQHGTTRPSRHRTPRPHRVHQPGRRALPLAALARGRGHLNLVTQTRNELEDTFVAMGFAVAEGPEAETDWYNFEALNMPPAHPARGMWDTLYLRLGPPETVLLRTHTSPVQIRLMESQPPPIYAVMPGRCYRRDTPDARHLPVFHQIEGLVVDRGITFGDLAGTIEAFTNAYFGPGMHSRLRPSYFPFTEPSAEFEVTCPICAGAGCRTCSGSGWIELGGCGMVDPNVFAAVGHRPRGLQRLRLRLRHRPAGPGARRPGRHADPARQRRPLPRAVLGPAMRAPLSWLRDYAPLDADRGRAGRACCPASGWSSKASRRSAAASTTSWWPESSTSGPIPNAERIRLVDVDTGDGETQIVCGAWNFQVGDLVPLAPVGAVLPGGFEISRRKMRGEWSNGMLCSAGRAAPAVAGAARTGC